MKKITSLILCFALLLGCLSTAAAASAEGDGFTALSVSEYGTVTNYTVSGGSAAEMVLGNTAYMQSFADIAASGLTDKAYTSLVTFRVNAPADGEYLIAPDFTVKDGIPSNYFLTVCINDRAVYKIAAAGAGDYLEKLSVSLDKGVNIIRLIARLKDTAAVAADAVSIKGLEIENTLSGEAAGTALTLYPNNATYKKYNAEGSTGVGGAGALLGNAIDREFTLESIKIGDIHLVPYFAFTVNAPKAGYYDISLGAYTGAEGASGKIAVFVDSQKYILGFKDYTASRDLNASVYIPAGDHTISVTSVYDWKSDVSAGGVTSEFYRSWSNYYSLVFESGNVALSATQAEPAKILDPTRIEAENTNNTLRSGEPSQSHGGCSGVACAGNFSYDFSGAQTFSQLTTYFDKSNTAAVTFSIYAPADGSYTLTPGYYCYTHRDTYYIIALVNDTAAYKVDFVERGASGYNKNSFNANLNKGMNFVRLILATSDNTAPIINNYINIDYLDLDPALTASYGVNRLEAEASKNNQHFSGKDGALTGQNKDVASNKGITTGSLTINNWTAVAYFTYNITAPYDGYYDISLLYRAGFEYSNGVMAYPLMVDSTIYTKYARKYSGGDGFENNRINMSVYLTSGEHNLIFMAQTPEAAGGTYYWNDFDAVIFYGGITKAENQPMPVTINYEGETAYLHNFTAVYNNTTTYSSSAFSGIWNFHHTQSEEELKTYIDPNTGYTVFSVIAPSDGTYKMTVRFKFGCQGDTADADYNSFKTRFGTNPYAVLVSNGRLYKVIHPTQNGWTSTAETMNIELKEGLNQIYAMAPTTEVAREFTNAFIEYDSIKFSGDLKIAEPNYFTLGDINADEDVDLRDLLRLKRYLSGQSVAIDREEANFARTTDYAVNADSLTGMKKMLLLAGTAAGAQYGGVQQPIDTPDYSPNGKVSLNNEKIYFSPYSWHDGGDYRLAALGGAYIKAAFTGSTFGIKIDRSRLLHISPSRLCVNAYIDGSSTPICTTLGAADMCGVLNFTTSLSSGNHYIEIYFSGSDDEEAYKYGSPNALCVTGFNIAAGERILNLSDVGRATKSGKLLFFGDSITEGIGTNSNDEKGYAPTIARTLGYEYGQCGNAGIGWTLGGCRNFVDFYIPQEDGFGKGFWREYIEGVSRFVDDDPTKGYIDGAPDAVFVNLGENDAQFRSNLTTARGRLTGWLTDMRKVLPENTPIFVIVPFNYGGTKFASYSTFKGYITGGFNDYKAANPNDNNVHLLDLGSFGWTTVRDNSTDQVHPNQTAAKILGERLAELARPYL